MTFRVGQKVAAVKSAVPRDPTCKLHIIPAGTVCTIREIDTRCIAIHGMATVRVVEFVNDIKMTRIGPWEGGYRPDCFRPIVERKTDISVFTEILRKATKPAPATPVAQHHRG